MGAGWKAVVPAAGALAVCAAAALLILFFVHPAWPLFEKHVGPYAHSIAAEGVIETDQAGGASVYVFPEVSGTVVSTFVKEGDAVKAGQPLFAIDDTAQRATAEGLRLQAAAAQITLRKMRAPARKEAVAVAVAQVEQARAALKAASDQHRRLAGSQALDKRSVSRQSVDDSADAMRSAEAGVKVAERELDLLRAGSSKFEIDNQAAQTAALDRAYDASKTLLGKFVVRASADGVVLSLNVPKGAYVAPAGVYDNATEYSLPPAILARAGGELTVRCYVDQAQAALLPVHGPLTAAMTPHGGGGQIGLEFVRILPLVIPRVALTPQDKDHGDPRVLPVIFRVRVTPQTRLYPGQLVDVYIRQD